MNHSGAIFIFTKDRPNVFSRTMGPLQSLPYTKYVIDDSFATENQKTVSKLCQSYSNCLYIGKAEFRQFTKRHHIGFPEFDFLLREIGSQEWNLGYARNFALLYSKSIGVEKVLFTDDDIEVQDPNLIEELFQEINEYKFVGANIGGLVDDSVLGHIATDIGISNERMLSGGFMAFNPNTIDHFFLNNYNEDWIWLFLQLKGKKYLQTGEVSQEWTDPLANYKSKVMFQEFGETALDGILDLHQCGNYDSLVLLPFWERIVKEREEYLDLLLGRTLIQDKKSDREIIEWVKCNSKNFNASSFRNLFSKYFRDKKRFDSLYQSLS